VLSAEAHRGGKSRRAEKRRKRAIALGLLVRKGGSGAAKAGAILRRRHGGLAATRGIGGERQAALLRRAKGVKREEQEQAKRLRQRLAAEREASIRYARFGPSPGNRAPDVCGMFGCRCQATRPGHFPRRPAPGA
jgi:hypothetical protein